VFGIGTSFPINTTTEYVAQSDILMLKGKKPASELKAFNAKEVRENLEPSIRRPGEKDQEEEKAEKEKAES
jgi:hypothetical protein